MSKNTIFGLILVGIVSYLLTVILVALFGLLNSIYDKQTKMLCLEYAKRNHEMEFVPERWAIVKDLYSVDQWYESCINSNK